jgi:hypothetical protein
MRNASRAAADTSAIENVSSMSRRAYARAAVAILLLAAAIGYFSLHRPPLTAKDTVVLGDFENKTGDPVFDQTLRQGLTLQLEQSPFVTLISDQQIQNVLRFMNRPPETRLTRDVSREVCERTGGSAVLEGSIAGLGSQYVLWLRAGNARPARSSRRNRHSRKARKRSWLR